MSITPLRAWTLVACLAFVFATAYAVAVVLFRLPFLLGDHGHHFRVALVLHVELAVFFWLMATTAMQWAGHRPAPGGIWLAGIALAGTALLALSPLAGGTPLMADYFPWLDGNPWFALGFALFCAPVLLMALRVLGRRAESSVWSDVQLAAWPTLMALLTLLSDAWNGARGVSQLAWGAGHALLFAHACLMCRDWSALSASDGKVERLAMRLLAAVSLVLPLIPFFFAPGSAEHRQAFTTLMSWLLWPPVALVAASYAWRRGAIGLFRPAPWLLYAAMALFAAGGVMGALIDGETTLVTAHYHATVGAVAISRMGVAYLFARETAWALPSPRAMRGQLLAYTVGLVLLAGGLAVGSVDHAPRKTSAGELVTRGPWFKLGMSISGVGGLFAMVGAGWLVLNLLHKRDD